MRDLGPDRDRNLYPKLATKEAIMNDSTPVLILIGQPRPRVQVQELEPTESDLTGNRLRRLEVELSVEGEELNEQLLQSVATSITSRVWNEAGHQVGHLALMNLHPVGFYDLSEIRAAVRLVDDGSAGYILDSGRYFHYYGRRFLDLPASLKFLSQFLMPCVLVSPRYIGHSLYRGFCTLRLNAAPPFKPVVPVLVNLDAR
jgi:hypothetical protein